MKKFLYFSKKGAKIISYKEKPNFEIIDIKESDIETLHEFIEPKDIVSVSFETNLYADTGEFVSLSKLATHTAIRNAVNNLGIFGGDFEISFKKIKQIDKAKALFYYIAVNKDDFSIIDSLDCTIKQCVPSEIAIQNLFCFQYPKDLPILAILEKDDDIKAILIDNDKLNTKTIRKEGFQSEYQELANFIEGVLVQYKLKSIYCLGSAELWDSLEISGIKPQKPHFKIGSLTQDNILEYIEILGLLYPSKINFLTPKHKENYEAYKHSQIAIKIATLLFVICSIFLLLGFSNYFKILSLKNKLNTNLASFEQSTASLNTNINATKIQDNIDLYINYQKIPRLDSILAELSNYKLPNLYFIEVDVLNTKDSSVQNATSNAMIGNYSINIKGVVFGDLKDAKDEFNDFLSKVSKSYKVNMSNFYYLSGKLLFDVNLEKKNVSF